MSWTVPGVAGFTVSVNLEPLVEDGSPTIHESSSSLLFSVSDIGLSKERGTFLY